MSEKRYFKIEYKMEWYLFDSTTISEQLVKEQAEYGYGVFANSLSPSEVVDLLNEQQDTIITLKRRLEKINGGYGHLTHRNGLTANEWLIESHEKELEKKNGQISDWIEQHSKDIVKIGEQKTTISQLEEENDNMNLFIKQTIEPLLFNCVFELNTIESMSQVELAEKIEDEIIPFIQNFKYLKYESLEEEKQDKSE